MLGSVKPGAASPTGRIQVEYHSHRSWRRNGMAMTTRAYRLKAANPMKRTGSPRTNVRTAWFRVISAAAASRMIQPILNRASRSTAIGADTVLVISCSNAFLAQARVARAPSRLGPVGQGDNRGQHQRRRAG